jgi:hypothetical protein
VDFSLAKDEQDIVEEVRAYIASEATDELREELSINETVYGGPLSRAFIKPLSRLLRMAGWCRTGRVNMAGLNPRKWSAT